MTVYELIKILEKQDPHKRIGIMYDKGWPEVFGDDLLIEEIEINESDTTIKVLIIK